PATCIYITTIVERYPNYLTGEFIRYLDGSLGFISQLKSVGAFTHRFSNGKDAKLGRLNSFEKYYRLFHYFYFY
ncbi:MAG: hypothetical protein RIM23_08865, partial [Coleofasciculus sp. G3-WIS-01]|uniref:hypothetical protein n=1 Tax=Coleofasciculus sp. G3-WIS-01 TaxID=3069528 RepID=UPI0033025BED